MTNGPTDKPLLEGQGRPRSTLDPAKNQHRCPMCLSGQHVSDGVEMLTNGIVHNRRCVSCHTTWHDNYAFTGFTIVSSGNNKE